MLQHVSHGLRALLRSLGTQRELPTICAHWTALIGDHLAAHSAPSKLSANELVVTVDDPGWASEVRFAQARLLAGLDELLAPGRVSSISVVVRRQRRD